MASSDSSSAQQAREDLADRLGEIRLDAGLKGSQLAQRLGWYPSKVSRIQTARTSPSADDIRAWCTACGAEDQAADLIQRLRDVEGMFVDWRRMERDGLRHAQEAVRPLFERTTRFRAYSSWFVPGLIQSRAYTEAVLRAVQRRRVAVDDVDAAVAARMDRQQILHEGGRTFAFLVEESVLRSGMGGREVMAGQLGQLITVGSLPNVSLGVVPMSASRSRMPVEGFWIYDSVQVNVELVSGYLTLTQQREVAMYAETFAELSELAVYGAEARSLIALALRALG
ncbi:helix-turn-helix domain-containing protein [Streptomyces spectabilis]|uniref:Transcriptional regulator with XRE-family HTH domain n=1 Tax=Streptomyces spectabilis TaxID=68270 RepID=A0A5P2X7U8_STRST|nr:helix-turn-helix transcriptional regulator [Streptomyces spectabilis]MBB5108402.1 transcriptional regulator with XRE-family HTH domain [Streptomyces spectabilis]MCI3901155.1 helix-turn-helix transcriptional regulator [Streptomyces spectabilis]QEV58646.1 XRE family transcriptional regulator [Streptomyces spectabilis]GGV46298.1 transcriptional regulator [Streptomyces spectabilis]